jgi:hypothetical protein
LPFTDNPHKSLLTPSTTVAFPQVFSRRLTYFHVVNSSVSAVQEDLQSGFDSRQLHPRSRPGRKVWPALCHVDALVNIRAMDPRSSFFSE